MFGQRGEERVDRRVLRPIVGPWSQIEVAIGEPHLYVWRSHVQVIWLHAHAVGDLKDRHRRVTREERWQCALVLRRQMLDEDEGEAGLRRQCADHAREGLEATG